MKKELSLILFLTLFLTLFLCACGGKDTPVTEATEAATTAATEPSAKQLALGETATTEVMEFTLTEVEFADRLSLSSGENYLTPIEEYELGNLVPNDGKVFVCFSFTVKNIGKEKLDADAYGRMELLYSDGYTFEISSGNVVRTDDSYYLNNKTNGLLSMEALSGAQEYRGYIEVSAEVMENGDAPLEFKVWLQKGEESFGLDSEIYREFIFDLRS